MAGPERKKKCPPEGAPDWMTTYGDMVTLLLCFFVMLYTTASVDGEKLKLILAAFSGLGIYEGGNTLQAGDLAEMGHSIDSLPSMQSGRALDHALKQATSLFQPELQSKNIKITTDERGLIISLSGDAFFRRGSANVNIESTRKTLEKLSTLLAAPFLSDRRFRIEGHTDSTPTDPDGPWTTNWELSAARAANVLHYLVDFGVNEEQFQIMGLADTQPFADNATPEGRAYNRRVDIIVVTDGHL